MAKQCKPGYILSKVGACIIDKGKTPESQKVLPKLKGEGLGKYGLKDLQHMKVSDRMIGYEKAIKAEGYAPIVRRLNVLANYTKNSNPKFHELVKKDMERIKKKLSEYSLSSSKKSSKKATKKSSKKATKKSSKKATKKSSKKATKKSSKNLKAGKYTTRDGIKKQLYRLQGSSFKFYRYKGSDGKMKKRYV
jgi:hypothetical protein